MGMSLKYAVLKPIKIDPLKKIRGENDLHKPFTLKVFQRSLLAKERKASVCIEESLILQFSYGGYNSFRSILCESFLNKTPDLLFNELHALSKKDKYELGIYHIINFADNEGYIGPTAVVEISNYLKRCEKNKSLNKKLAKFKKIDSFQGFYQDLLNFIKSIHVAAEKKAYLLIT